MSDVSDLGDASHPHSPGSLGSSGSSSSPSPARGVNLLGVDIVPHDSTVVDTSLDASLNTSLNTSGEPPAFGYRGGTLRMRYLCDCATITDVCVETPWPLEFAWTCDGCMSVHWVALAADTTRN
jgi:hypothetical protein